ncbi:serine/threonine-protein kinase [Methanocella conradii]|uniref:serine/threonine-protein kinase n=1 Tax=Methanocella conradii TaxID=1175444 RepID=UPI00157C2071|nr:serine/threonine-protein kinase [Methanocella conradii]
MPGDRWRQVGGMTEDTVMPGGGLRRSWNYESPDRHWIPEEMKITVGSLIGEQYEVRQILGGEGKSGMGIVYVCYDRSARQMYALKTFQDKYLYSGRARESFRQEALAWVLLDAHPNIVQAVGVEALDNRLFIVLEYVEPDDAGRNTLTHYLNSISLLQAIEWAIQFCDGMAYAASHGVTPHRDIKPDNIMISRDGTLKVTDFGLARLWEGVLRSSDMDFSPYRSVVGTSPWMAPEQFDGVSDLRSDIYSFGVIMYQMANGGRQPFIADSVEGYHRAHCEAKVPYFKSRLFPIIRKCLKKSPDDRYGDFKSLRADLERLYRSLMGVWPPAPARRVEPAIWEYNNRGLALYNVGLVDEAIWVYRKALRVDPVLVEQHKARLATVHNNLGVAYDARGQVDMAIDEYREALRLNPCLADAHNNLGTALRAKGMLDEAMREYLHALRLNPDSAMAHNNLGLSYACRGELDRAIREYKEAIRLKPGLVEARVNLGLALAMKGRLDKAIDEYRKAARMRPDDAIIHFNLANALRAVGRIEEAILEYSVSLWIEPGNAEARHRLGLSLEDAGRLQDAISEYIGTLRLEPGHAAVVSSLEGALRRSGMPEAAIEAYINLLAGKRRR